MFHMPSLGMWLVSGMLVALFFGKRLPLMGKDVVRAIRNFKNLK